MRIVLIGYRGTGKSTVAGQLAARLGWDCVDTDEEIEARAGKSIAAIFAEEGEPRFRDLETNVLADLQRRDRMVLSVGGGAPMRPENRAALAHGGKVVWLRAAAETILARLQRDSDTPLRRPALTAHGPEAEVVELLGRRGPIYRQCADVVVDTDDKTPADVAAEILSQLDLTP